MYNIKQDIINLTSLYNTKIYSFQFFFFFFSILKLHEFKFAPISLKSK